MSGDRFVAGDLFNNTDSDWQARTQPEIGATVAQIVDALGSHWNLWHAAGHHGGLADLLKTLELCLRS